MHKSILLLMFFSLSSFAQENTSKGKVVNVLDGFMLPTAANQGNILATKMKDRAVYLLDKDGKEVRRITPVLHSFISKYGGHDLVVGNSGQKVEVYTTEAMGDVRASFSSTNCANSREVSDGVLLTLSDKRLLKLSKEGKVIKQATMPEDTCVSTAVFPDGTILAHDIKKVYVLNKDLKLVGEKDYLCLYLVNFGDLMVCPRMTKDTHFLLPSGEIKFTFSRGGAVRNFLSLPNGLGAITYSDGNIYFINDLGEVKHTHVTDTKYDSHLIQVNEGTIAYMNRTEIVFLDLQGNEKGTFKLLEERTSTVYLPMFGLGNGRLVYKDEKGRLIFVQVEI